jgi:hypothetical protein
MEAPEAGQALRVPQVGFFFFQGNLGCAPIGDVLPGTEDLPGASLVPDENVPPSDQPSAAAGVRISFSKNSGRSAGAVEDGQEPPSRFLPLSTGTARPNQSLPIASRHPAEEAAAAAVQQ